MFNEIDRKIKEVCRAFSIPGKYLGASELKIGNVNKTYIALFASADGEKRYIVQSVNTYAFREPEHIMHNIDLVTGHIHKKCPGRMALSYYHTDSGTPYLSENGEFWRISDYMPSRTFLTSNNPDIVRKAGAAFGEFQVQLSDFDALLLYETIPNFHNTKIRLETLFKDAERDELGMKKDVAEELRYIESVADEAMCITRMLESGELPLRATHNDTKINNVLFDRDNLAAIAVIDLDTVMPGAVAHDFGDAVRYSANYVAEDSSDYEKVGCNLTVFRAFTEGFLSQTAHMLTENELDTLAVSPFVMTVELAARFLDDYILGSPYFHTSYPEHNLVRTRCQIELARDFKRKLPEMRDIIRECAESARK